MIFKIFLLLQLLFLTLNLNLLFRQNIQANNLICLGIKFNN